MWFETKKAREVRLEREKREAHDKKLKAVGQVVKFIIEIILGLAK